MHDFETTNCNVLKLPTQLAGTTSAEMCNYTICNVEKLPMQIWTLPRQRSENTNATFFELQITTSRKAEHLYDQTSKT